MIAENARVPTPPHPVITAIYAIIIINRVAETTRDIESHGMTGLGAWAGGAASPEVRHLYRMDSRRLGGAHHHSVAVTLTYRIYGIVHRRWLGTFVNVFGSCFGKCFLCTQYFKL